MMKIAVDIGTTTVILALAGPQNEILTSASCLNRQASLGKDVISRIKASNEGKADELQDLIRQTLDEGIRLLSENFRHSPNFLSVSPEERKIERITIAANTTMVHLLLHYSCKTLGVYPFSSNHLSRIHTKASAILPSDFGDGFPAALSFSLSSSVPVDFLPGLSVFVGGDLTGGLIASGLDTKKEVSLLLDLGTNGEMILGNQERLAATSTAAGPAFEGMGKTYGSEILHAAASMLRQHIISADGLLKEPYFRFGYPYTTGAGRRILFHQKDIRNLQMAKAAIRSGISILCEAFGLPEKDLEAIYLSGHFGSAADPADATAIGLLPEGVPVKILGNSSLYGAIQADALSAERLQRIKSRTEELYLANSPVFTSRYLEFLNFPA